MGASVMVITGSAHSNLYAMDYNTGHGALHGGPAAPAVRRGPAGPQPLGRHRLHPRRGYPAGPALPDGLHRRLPGRTGPVQPACRGTSPAPSGWSRGAYEAACALPATGEFLPYDNYLNPVEEGQVYRVDYLLADGSAESRYYRADGTLWQGQPATAGFAPESV